MQPCCFEQKRNKNGFKRLIKGQIINNTSLTLANYNKNKKKSSKQKELNKTNSQIYLTGTINKGTPEKIKKNNNNIQNTYTFNKSKKNKNKSSSVDSSKQIKRKNTYDANDEGSNFNKNNNKFKKKIYAKGTQIGEGKYCKIYSGYILSNGDLIAIKTYYNLSEKQKNRIIKNLDTLYKLEHKNIIKAISLSDGDIYDENLDLNIVFETVSPENVNKIINSFGSLDDGIIQKYVKQVLEALQYLHEKKIYHKNLKSYNIFVENEATIKISDCYIDSLILGNAKEIYLNLLKSNEIDYYIPPFFIQSIQEYKKNKNIDNFSENSDDDDDNIFNDWQSYDLWFLGCLIIEVASNKKPWSGYIFKNNQDFFEFLGSSNVFPTIPKTLSIQCQELITILLNYDMTKKLDIYNAIFDLDFFKMDPKDFTYNNINNIFNNKFNGINHLHNLSGSQSHCIQNEESNTSINNNINSESGTQLGQILANNKVVNILNSNNNASFSVSYTAEDNTSLTQSYNLNNRINQSGNVLNQSNLSRGKHLNNININTFNNDMTAVPEAPIEYSPDPVKDSNEINFNFNTK